MTVQYGVTAKQSIPVTPTIQNRFTFREIWPTIGPMLLFWVDMALYVVHLAVTGFNLLGWIVPRLRRLHRWCVGLTAFCWLGAGAWVGAIGYCPLTDWHWQVKRLRGAEDLPNSFITLMLNHAGLFPRPDHVDMAVGATFAGIVLVTVCLWGRERFYKREQR